MQSHIYKHQKTQTCILVLLCYNAINDDYNLGPSLPNFPVFQSRFICFVKKICASYSFEPPTILFMSHNKKMLPHPQYNCSQFIKALLDALELHQQHLWLLHWFENMRITQIKFIHVVQQRLTPFHFSGSLMPPFRTHVPFQSVVCAQGRQSHLLLRY